MDAAGTDRAQGLHIARWTSTSCTSRPTPATWAARPASHPTPGASPTRWAATRSLHADRPVRMEPPRLPDRLREPGTSATFAAIDAPGIGQERPHRRRHRQRHPGEQARVVLQPRAHPRRPPQAHGDGARRCWSPRRSAPRGTPYAAYSGTSMSTPAVAGAMALVRQYLTRGLVSDRGPGRGQRLRAVGRIAPGHGRERRAQRRHRLPRP